MLEESENMSKMGQFTINVISLDLQMIFRSYIFDLLANLNLYLFLLKKIFSRFTLIVWN